MADAQPLARQQRGKQHDQQRPQIGDQARLGRRRPPQRGEVKRVIAEQPADADQPDRPRLGDGAEAPARGGEAEAERAADRKRQRRQFERRNLARRGGQQRERGPQQDGEKTDEGGAGVDHAPRC